MKVGFIGRIAVSIGLTVALTAPAFTQPMSQAETMALWKQVYADRTPLATIRKFPALSAPSPDPVINERDATDAINLIIQKRQGTFTPEELKRISDGLHLSELAAESEKQSVLVQQAGAMDQYLKFSHNLGSLLDYAIVSSPNKRATEQLEKGFDRFFPVHNYLAIAELMCSGMNLDKTRGFRCAAFDEDMLSLGSSPAPSLLALAKMSQFAYQLTNSADVDGYELIDGPVTGEMGFAAVTFQHGNQIVIAFRGTELDSSVDTALKDLSADGSWVFGNTEAFDRQVVQAAGLLTKRLQENPSARITVTGHSLGGAIAQILGARTGVPAAGFNAPGGANRLMASGQTLAGVAMNRFPVKGNNVNYRMLGDYISTVGPSIGAVCTIFQPLPSPDPLANHTIGLLVLRLANSSTPRAPAWIDNPDNFPSGLSCPIP